MECLLAVLILAQAAHPGLYHTPEDIARARLNIERFTWAREVFEDVRIRADEWAAKTDNELRALVPPPGSIFAYGFSGCPECGANWPWWGAKGVASFDKPGKATCPSCKRTFPDAEHPDDGGGWHNPKDGKTYYFTGCYNSFAAQRITLNILQDLSIAYSVTGDRKYSHAAAVLYDRLADTYPTATVGSTDYPMKGNHGRLERPQYQVARVLVLLAKYLDLFYDSPDFTAPSTTGQGSVREHIERSVIRDGGAYCFKQASDAYSLSNGQADYVRGTLITGIMLGERDWIDCGLKGPCSIFNFLENCLDGDGQYYETSVGYGGHALSVYLDMAEALYNFRSPEYPNGVNLYEHPKFRKALFDAGVDLDFFGHFPRFGDWGPDHTVVTDHKHYSHTAYTFSERLFARARDEDKKRWADALAYVCDGDVGSRRGSSKIDRSWQLFHAEPLPESDKYSFKVSPHPVLGAKGAAALRGGRGAKGHAAFLRYGPSLNHGHRDDLNLNFFGLGRELTYDLGYSLGSAHVQVGWTNLTASHNLVVVNEKNQMVAPGGGGSLHFYAEGSPVKVMEASSEASYASEKVDAYRRMLALVDITPDSSYLIDIFRVAGGDKHDLMWHFGGKLDNIQGARMGQVQSGSLAGSDIEWGSKVGPAGYLIGCADKGDYWNPPPGNGYGFLFNVKKAKSTSSECKALWSISEDGRDRLALHLLAEPDSQLVTAKGPAILPDMPKADYTVLRREGNDLRSSFISVLEPTDAGFSVKAVKRLECDAPQDAWAVGVQVDLGGWTDYVVSAFEPVPVTFHTQDGDISFNGRFGFLRIKDGMVKRASLVGGTELSLGSFNLSSPQPALTGKIAEADYGKCEIRLDMDVPLDLSGQMVYINREGYSHNSPYRIRGVGRDGRTLVLDSSMVLGRGHVGKSRLTDSGALANVVPLPQATVVSRQQSGYFRGKAIQNDRTGKTTVITDVEKDQKSIKVKDQSIFSPGDDLTIYDVRTGDDFLIPIVLQF